MAKFKIQPEPTFTSLVKIPRVGGDPIEVPFTFKYMDRDALAKLFKQWADDSLAVQEKFSEGELDLPAFTAGMMETQCKQIKDIVIGWDFDDEFNDESVMALVKTSVSVPAAVISTYQEAFQRSRLGNLEA
jgi:hypothetical protein